MVQLLQKLSIRATNGPDKLLKVLLLLNICLGNTADCAIADPSHQRVLLNIMHLSYGMQGACTIA